MLQVTIPARELWDERTQTFITTNETTISLEHSLVSISKWEAKWHKQFLSEEPKTFEETIDYIRCMTLTQNVDPSVYNYLTRSNVEEINKYIENPMTATVFYDDKKETNKRKQVTSEIIYSWMIGLNIPVDFQKWHLNRLLTLIHVCSNNNQPEKKMSKQEIMARNSALNAQRRARLHSKG